MRLAYTRIVTSEVSTLAEYYASLLNVPTLGSDQYAEVCIQGNGIAIVSKRSVDLFSGGAAEPAANRSIILDFEVEDVDQEYSRLESQTIDFVLKPTNQPWGNRSMLFRDPEGNLINFFSRRSSNRLTVPLYRMKNGDLSKSNL